MENFETNIHLFYTAAATPQSNNYYLHVITYPEHAGYRAGGQPVSIKQNGKTLDVELPIIRDQSIPPLNQDAPIVHTIFIGAFNESVCYQINVSVVLLAETNNTKIGEAVLSTVDAVEDTRPIEQDSRFSGEEIESIKVS